MEHGDDIKESMAEMIKKHIMENSYIASTDEIDMQEALNFVKGKLEELNEKLGDQGIDVQYQIDNLR
jgi:hypothetical protein